MTGKAAAGFNSIASFTSLEQDPKRAGCCFLGRSCLRGLVRSFGFGLGSSFGWGFVGGSCSEGN